MLISLGLSACTAGQQQLRQWISPNSVPSTSPCGVLRLQAKTTLARTKQPASVQKLHHVLAPKLKQSVRSTKALTLPDDFELQTSKRCGGRPASAPVGRLLVALSGCHCQHSVSVSICVTAYADCVAKCVHAHAVAAALVTSAAQDCVRFISGDMCRPRARSSLWLSGCVSSSTRPQPASSQSPQQSLPATRRSHPSPRQR